MEARQPRQHRRDDTHVDTVGGVLTDCDEGQRFSILAGARAEGSPARIAAAEDAVFRHCLPMAVEMASAAGEPSGAAELEQAAELGLAQAVLAWRRSDGFGFAQSARRSISHRLRMATAPGWTAEAPITPGRPLDHLPANAIPQAGPVLCHHAVEVAMLDRTGVIISVNDAWREFSTANGGNGSRTGVGMSYLAVCDAAEDDEYAREVAAMIRAAAAGDLSAPVIITVPCHAPAVQRWYDVLISPRWNRRFRVIGVAVTLTLRAAAPVR